MPRSLHVKLDGGVTPTDQFHMQTAEQVTRRDEPLDPQQGRGLVFFVMVIWQESQLPFLAKTNMGALDR